MNSFHTRTTRATIVTLSVAISAAVVLSWLLLRPSATAPITSHSDDRAVQYVPATARAIIAGCDVVDRVLEPTSPVREVPGAGMLPYDSMVPNSGWFADSAAPAGSTTGTLEQSVRHLHGGGMVLWHSVGASQGTVDTLTRLAQDHPQWDAVVWQWPTERSWQLTDNRVAVAVWGASQTCSELNEDVVRDVIKLGSLGQPITSSKA